MLAGLGVVGVLALSDVTVRWLGGVAAAVLTALAGWLWPKTSGRRPASLAAFAGSRLATSA